MDSKEQDMPTPNPELESEDFESKNEEEKQEEDMDAEDATSENKSQQVQIDWFGCMCIHILFFMTALSD